MENRFTKVTKENHIAKVEVNHAPANALSSLCIAELREVFKALSTDDETRAIILTGAGRFFVAGADIKEFIDALGDQQKGLEMAEAGQALCNEIEALNKPVIAAINGPALGGGLELAMGCHYRIASEKAILGLPELKLGLIPAFGGTQRLRRFTDLATAIDIVLTGRQLSSADALQNGLVELVVPEEDLLKIAFTVANSFIEGKSMTSVTRAIDAVTNGYHHSLEDGLKRERESFSELFITEDAKEGIHAFVEKRKPHFKHC